MQIYISSSRDNLPVARQLADLLAQLGPDTTGVPDVTIHIPPDDPARAERWMAESGFVVLLLSPAALRDAWVARDLEQVRRLRAEGAVKHFVVVLLQPLPPDALRAPALDGLRTVDAITHSLNEVARELAYYATWRPRQTGGRIFFAPPAPPPAYGAPPPVQSMEPPLEEEERERGITYTPPPAQSAAPPAPGGAPPPPVPFAPPSMTPPPPPAPYGPPPGSAPPPAVGRATGAPAPRKRKAEPVSDTADAHTLQFSAYHPNTVAVETWQTLLVYTYLADALAQIQADAATFTELGSAPTIARGQTTRAVARGVELIVEPHMEGVTFSPERETFVWRGDWRRSLFRFSGAAALAGQTPRGWIDIYAAPRVPVARIDLALPFHDASAQQLAAQPPRGMIVTSNIYDSVFISYSHRDTEAFRQACAEYRRFDISVYTDELLEAGAQYERELERMIAQANVFHLLWSPHTATSGECRKEWMTALAREPSERFIKPWYWKQPLASLPNEFVQHRISFKYEPLKRRLWRPRTWF